MVGRLPRNEALFHALAAWSIISTLSVFFAIGYIGYTSFASEGKASGGRQPHYWLRDEGVPYHEVSLRDFVKAEREAGFFPKNGSDGLATQGFAFGASSGAITFDGKA